MQPMETIHVECSCCSAEHVIRFIYDPDTNDFYLEVQLTQYRNILKRIWVAIKYIFGYQCRYGHWDCWLLNPKDCDEIIKLLNRVVEKDKADKK